MTLRRKPDLTTAELKEELKRAGVNVQPSYMHKDYRFTSFTAPYPVMNQLKDMTDFIGCSRSNFIQALIIRAYERFEKGESAFGD